VPDFFPFPGRLSGRGRSGKAEGRVQCQWEFKINHMWKRAQRVLMKSPRNTQKILNLIW